MLYYIGKRFLQSLVVIFIVTLFAFVLVHAAPGNPARMMAGEYATDEQVAAMEERMGFNKPIYEQFWMYLEGLAHGDFGMSVVYNQPVLPIIFSRLPVTVQLAVGTVLVACLLSIPLGVIAGVTRAKFIEFFAMFFALLGQSMSSLWLGILLIYIFAVKLGWLPAIGTGGIEYLILPVLTMGYPMAATLTRVARSGMIDTMNEDYITATYAKGISNFQVYTKYALRNAMIPVITLIGLDLAMQLSGSVIVESVFSRAGVGQLMNQSVTSRDYAMIQAMLLISSFLFTFVNFIVDVINSIIDPRLSLY
ncbi:MAG: ABC transporter permease [Peptococcaceae bacterium]|jgi:peptide/nickel transport system permease protein|nr:ABC transporter permease [Peptococcaceae bacterium]